LRLEWRQADIWRNACQYCTPSHLQIARALFVRWRSSALDLSLLTEKWINIVLC
jgi:hypothetical protein